MYYMQPHTFDKKVFFYVLFAVEGILLAFSDVRTKLDKFTHE